MPLTPVMSTLRSHITRWINNGACMPLCWDTLMQCCHIGSRKY